ncbi:MAG: Holliday junction resolvase RuvX [Clostridia bacterium]|nr:Holliday junction resolvase RuvX [Clostridia bacterium]
MIIMAIDLGKARTGLAVCDKNEILASPIGTIQEKDDEKLILKILENLTSCKAEMAIIGLPKNMDGSLGESAERAKKFADILREKIDIPINLWDERRTTIAAHNYLNQTNTRGKKRKNIIDTLSASIILENYLEFRKNSR